MTAADKIKAARAMVAVFDESFFAHRKQELRDTVAALADLAAAQAQEIARLKSKLARYAIHEEYDCPGDAPEFCGWLCSICGEHVEENGSGHLSDCVISGHNPNGDPIPYPEPAP